MKRLALAALGIFLAGGTVALAQSQGQPVTTIPLPATTLGGNKSGTVAAGGTFQLLFQGGAPSPENHNAIGTRHGCIIENNSSDKLYVSEGLTVGTATLTNSYVLAAGGTFYCHVSGVVLTGEIDITGTTTADAFYAVQF